MLISQVTELIILVNKSQDPDPPTDDFDDNDDDDEFDDTDRNTKEDFALDLSDDEKDLEEALANDKPKRSAPPSDGDRVANMATEEAEAHGITLRFKTGPDQRSNDSDREQWYMLNTELKWSYPKIAEVLGWGTKETIGNGVRKWRHRVEMLGARERGDSVQQPPPAQPQTAQQQFAAPPPVQPQFAPQPMQPRAPEEEDEIEVPEPEYGPPTLKEELTKLGNIMRDHKIKTETINIAMKALEDNPVRLESPRELHDFFHSWKVSSDYNVINIIVDRFFGYHAQKRRHEDRYGSHGRSHGYGPYGGGRYDDDDYYDRGRGRRPRSRRRYDDEYDDDYDDDYYDDRRRGRRRREKEPEPVKQGMSEEDVEKKIQAAREQERELAAKEKEVSNLEAKLDNMAKELAEMRNNPPNQTPMMTIRRPIRDADGNVVDEEIVEQPWAPEKSGTEKLVEEVLMQKLTEKPEPPPAQTGPSDNEMRAREDKIKAEMATQMEELKKMMGEKETDQIKAQLAEVAAKLEATQAENKSNSGEASPEIQLAIEQVKGQVTAMEKIADNTNKTMARGFDTFMYMLDPENAAVMAVAKADAQRPQNVLAGTRQDLADQGL